MFARGLAMHCCHKVLDICCRGVSFDNISEKCFKNNFLVSPKIYKFGLKSQKQLVNYKPLYIHPFFNHSIFSRSQAKKAVPLPLSAP
jgi:hypothetical protein